MPSITAKDISEIYVLVIQILFGIVIGISFTDYHKELVPFVPNFETLMIVTAYFTVLASFAGYSITIKIRPHKNVTRFIIDLFLLYLYYQLIYSPLHGFRYFLVIFSLIFTAYLIWQILEYREWKGNEYSKNTFKKTFVSTIIFLFFFVAIVILYNGSATIQDTQDGKLKYLVDNVEYLILCIILALLAGFRILIWKVNK